MATKYRCTACYDIGLQMQDGGIVPCEACRQRKSDERMEELRNLVRQAYRARRQELQQQAPPEPEVKIVYLQTPTTMAHLLLYYIAGIVTAVWVMVIACGEPWRW